MGGSEIAEIMQPAMHIGVFVGISAQGRVEYGTRLLRRGAVVEIDEPLAVDFAGQNREIGADRLDVEGSRRRFAIFLHWSEHGHRPHPQSAAMPSHDAEA